jgi:hypothetical protein
MSKSEQDPSGQNAKVVIVTCLITGLATLGTAFIAIIPQFRSADRGKIEELNQRVKKLSHNDPVPGETMSVTGTVRSEDGMQPLVGYDVFLLPESPPLLSAHTDDNGKFTFLAVPSDSYTMIVRHAVDGKSGQAVLDADEAELHMNGARVVYQIKK